MKKAYHKLALQLHPDKNPGDEVCPELAQAFMLENASPLRLLQHCAPLPNVFCKVSIDKLGRVVVCRRRTAASRRCSASLPSWVTLSGGYTTNRIYVKTSRHIEIDCSAVSLGICKGACAAAGESCMTRQAAWRTASSSAGPLSTASMSTTARCTPRQAA